MTRCGVFYPMFWAMAAVFLAAASAGAQTPAKVLNVDLSGAPAGLAAAVPVVAIDPRNVSHIVVVWRTIAPKAARGDVVAGNWVCHVSSSLDGGATFTDQVKGWDDVGFTRCNAPFVTISAHGDIYVGGTLTKNPPAHAEAGSSAAPAIPAHPAGAAGIARSSDGGRTWSATNPAIASNMLDRFDTDASIPVKSKEVPWDGARAVVDLSDDAIYITGGYPAPPGGKDHSQRFYAVSTDSAATFGRIRAFGDKDWPERWDSDIAAAHGLFALSYIADATPDAGHACDCVVFAVSADHGKSLKRYRVADASDFNIDTLVHYPELAADTSRHGRFALTLISADKTRVATYLTGDAGKTWVIGHPTIPADVGSVSRPAIAFSPNGTLAMAWRGYHADGGYDIYVAAARPGSIDFGPVLKVSTATSHLPNDLKTTYALRGDFHTTLAATNREVHLAWADARDGATLRVVYGRAPMAALIP